MKKRNWDWYALKYDLASLIIPRLEQYKTEYIKNGTCIPNWVSDEKKDIYSDKEIKELQEKWYSELDDMIVSFKQILNYNTGEDSKIGYDEKIIQIGLDKFAKYFQHFWD